MTETIEVVTDGDERVDQRALPVQLLAEAKANNVELIGPGGFAEPADEAGAGVRS